MRRRTVSCRVRGPRRSTLRYATLGSFALITKIVTMVLLSYSVLAWGQNPIGQSQWNAGVYKELPFSYPETLSKDEINGILLLLQSPSNHQVFLISYQSKDHITLKTCTHGIRKPLMCDAGEIIVFQKNNNNWNELPEQRSQWLQ